MAAHIAMGRIGEVYKQELKDTIYQICGRRDEQWEMISTRRDRSIAAFIQELNEHIRRQENQMCASMIDLKKAMTRITELEEDLKYTRDGYEEEMTILVLGNVAEIHNFLRNTKINLWSLLATREKECIYIPL